MSLFLMKKMAGIKLGLLSKFPLIVASPATVGFTRAFSVDTAKDTIELTSAIAQGGVNTTVSSITFSPDGKFFILGVNSAERLQVWRREGTGFVRNTPMYGPSFGVALVPGVVVPKQPVWFSADSVRFTGFSSTLGISHYYRNADGKGYSWNSGIENSSTAMSSQCGIISPDQAHILYGNNNTRNIELRITNVPVSNLPRPTTAFTPNVMRFTKDGKYLFVANPSTDSSITIYRRTNNTYAIARVINTSGASDLTLSPDEKHVAVGCYNAPFVEIYKWDAVAETLTKIDQQFSIPGRGDSLSYSPDGKMLAVGHEDPAALSKVSLLKRSDDVYTKVPGFTITDSNGAGSLRVGFGNTPLK